MLLEALSSCHRLRNLECFFFVRNGFFDVSVVLSAFVSRFYLLWLLLLLGVLKTSSVPTAFDRTAITCLALAAIESTVLYILVLSGMSAFCAFL